jgi:hypothetical protein
VYMCSICRGRHQKSYSDIAITLRYVLEISHNASTLWRKVVVFDSYHSRHMKIVIASYSYHSGLIGNVIAFYGYRSESMATAITCNAVTF